MKVYAVQFSNYEPAEIDSLWERREDAEARVQVKLKQYGWGWEVVEWDVHPAGDTIADEPDKA